MITPGGFVQREREPATRSTKGNTTRTKKTSGPFFFVPLVLFCGFCVLFRSRWAKPDGSVSSPERYQLYHASASHEEARYPDSGEPLPDGVCKTPRAAGSRDFVRRAGHPLSVRLAGQHPRTEECDGADYRAPACRTGTAGESSGRPAAQWRCSSKGATGDVEAVLARSGRGVRYLRGESLK